MKRRLTKKRLWTVSIAGSCTVFIILTPFESWFVHPVGKALLSVLLVWMAFGYRSLKTFAQTVFMFYVVSFLAAGTLIALETIRFSMLENHGFLNDYTASMYGSFSIILMVSALPVIWLINRWTDLVTKTRKLKSAKLANVNVQIGEDHFHGEALVDTGNELKDPITRAPVMVMEVSVLEDKLSSDKYKQIQTMVREKRMEDIEHVESWKERWRLIPFRTAGQDLQMMFALKPDNVRVNYDNTEVQFDSMLVGLEPQSLSSNGDFTMILPADPLQTSTNATA